MDQNGLEIEKTNLFLKVFGTDKQFVKYDPADLLTVTIKETGVNGQDQYRTQIILTHQHFRKYVNFKKIMFEKWITTLSDQIERANEEIKEMEAQHALYKEYDTRITKFFSEKLAEKNTNKSLERKTSNLTERALKWRVYYKRKIEKTKQNIIDFQKYLEGIQRKKDFEDWIQRKYTDIWSNEHAIKQVTSFMELYRKRNCQFSPLNIDHSKYNE